MTRFIVYPYNMRNRYSKELADAFGTMRVHPDRAYRPKEEDVVICWGKVQKPMWNPNRAKRVLNFSNHVNKLHAFDEFKAHGVSIPEYTEGLEQATIWINQGHKVVCRQVLSGFEGRGIVIAKTVEELVRAPLYVKYIPKQREYRIHVMNNEVIDITQKRLRNGIRDDPNRSRYIRNTDAGWIFSRRLDPYPEIAEVEAINAVAAIGLDFGAVDVVIGRDDNVPYVLEVNSAPGIMGTTFVKYVNSFKEKYSIL